MNITNDSLYFTLEVGPLEPEKRILLMESIKEKGIKFSKKGLTVEAKYSRIHSETILLKELGEAELLSTFFDALYNNKSLQEILVKLQRIYDETVSKMD